MMLRWPQSARYQVLNGVGGDTHVHEQTSLHLRSLVMSCQSMFPEKAQK